MSSEMTIKTRSKQEALCWGALAIASVTLALLFFTY
jgi:hypothetical protein